MFWIWLIYWVLNLVVCVCVCYRQRHVLQQKEQPEQRQGVFVWRSLKGNKKKEEMLVLIKICLLFKYFVTKHNKTLTKGDKFQLE